MGSVIEGFVSMPLAENVGVGVSAIAKAHDGRPISYAWVLCSV